MTVAFGPALNAFQDVARQWPEAVGRRLEAASAAASAAREAVQTEAEARAYCGRMRAGFWEALGGLPADAGAARDGAHEVQGTLEHLGIRIYKIVYESFPGMPVSALLYRPSDAAAGGEGRKRGGVVFLCGHYSEAKAAAEFQRVCLDLALHGLVVLCIDPLGQGERHQYAVLGRDVPLVPTGTFEHSYCGLQCLLTGGGVARYFAWDAVRAVDVLASLPEVDPTRIGATGNSGGGAQTVFLMLADERLAAAMPCTYITSLPAFYRTGQPLDGELCQAGTLAHGVDHAAMLCGFAPKPLLVGAAAYDYFPIEGTEQSVAEARRLYALLGAEERIGLAADRTLHAYSDGLREAAVRFFTRVLDRKERYGRRTIETLPEAALRCSLSGQLYRDRPGSRGVFELNRERLAARRPAPETGEETAARLARALGPMPALDATPVRPRYFAPREIPERDGCTAQQVFFWSEPEIAVAGTLLRPPAERAAGRGRTWLVLLPHGTASTEEALHEAFALARAGETAFIFDPRGRGAATSVPLTLYAPYDSWLGQESWTSYVEMLSGHTSLATRVYDVRRAVSFLEEHEHAAEVAVRGHGVAALWGYLAGALDGRIQAAHFTGMLPSWREVAETRIFDSDTITAAMVLPGVLQELDLPDLHRSYAGRELRIEAPLRVAALPEQLPLKRNA